MDHKLDIASLKAYDHISPENIWCGQKHTDTHTHTCHKHLFIYTVCLHTVWATAMGSNIWNLYGKYTATFKIGWKKCRKRCEWEQKKKNNEEGHFFFSRNEWPNNRNVWNITPLKHNIIYIVHKYIYLCECHLSFKEDISIKFLFFLFFFFDWTSSTLLLRSPSLNPGRISFFFALSLLIYLMYQQHKWLVFLSFLSSVPNDTNFHSVNHYANNIYCTITVSYIQKYNISIHQGYRLNDSRWKCTT